MGSWHLTLAMGLAFLPSIWSATIEISPNPGTVHRWGVDTSDKRILPMVGQVFSVRWSDPKVGLDSVRFEIDSMAWTKRCTGDQIEGGIDSLNQVAAISLGSGAFHCLDSSIHHVTLRFRLDGIRMETEWRFRLFPHQYVHAEADLEITGEVDESLEKEFRVIHARPIDTTLWDTPHGFRFSSGIVGRDLRAKDRYQGTLGCCVQRIDGVPGDRVTTFLHLMGHDSIGWQWQVSGSRYDFLRDTGDLPFSFAEARAIMQQHGVKVKLGPTFPTMGRSWQAYAYPSGKYWEIQEDAGSGDCVSGCISSTHTHYKIAANSEQKGVCVTQSPLFPSMPYTTVCHGNMVDTPISVTQHRRHQEKKGSGLADKERTFIVRQPHRNILGRKWPSQK